MTLNLLPEFMLGAPEIFLCLWAMIVLMVGVFQKRSDRESTYYLALVGFAFALFMLFSAGGTYGFAFNEMFKVTPLTQLLKGLIILASAAVFYMSFKHFSREQMNKFEYPVLVILATAGMLLMVSANDLILAFIGLEIQSLSLYVAVAIARDRLSSTEAGLKYFVLGALATAFFLFGASYLYGFTGTTEFNGMAAVLRETPQLPVPITIAFMMILISFGFKVSLAPFHMWTPDVYDGSPTPVTAFIATAPKVAGFALLINFLTVVFGAHQELWVPVLSWLCIITIMVGSFTALFQKKLKRLIAYSSISHMGFVLLGFLSVQANGYENIFNYLIIYVIMTIGVFAVLLSLRKRGKLLVNVDDLTGLSKDSPFLAMCLTILLFSLAGVPPFAGFFAKLAVIQNAVSGDYYLAVILAVLGSVVSAAYYLRVIKAMYFYEPLGGDHTLTIEKDIPLQTTLVLVCSTAFVAFYVFAPTLFSIPVGLYFK